jgi:hypothetical protein
VPKATSAIRKFVEVWPVWRQIFETASPEMKAKMIDNPALVEALQGAYDCIVSNNVKTVEGYNLRCASATGVKYSDIAAFVRRLEQTSLAASPAPEGGEGRRYLRPETRARMAVDSAAGELITELLKAQGEPAIKLVAFGAELAALLIPLGVEVASHVGMQNVMDVPPREAARRVYEALLALWKHRTQLEAVEEEFNRLREENRRLKAAIALYERALDAVCRSCGQLVEVLERAAEAAERPDVAAVLRLLETAE